MCIGLGSPILRVERTKYNAVVGQGPGYKAEFLEVVGLHTRLSLRDE